MKNSFKVLAISVVGLVLSACAPRVNITFMPRAEGLYSVKATSYDSHAAMSGAIMQAQTVCAGQGKAYEVIKNDMKYNGVDQNVAAVATMFTGASSMRSDNDYEVDLEFRCH